MCTVCTHITRTHIINSFSDLYSYLVMLKDSMPVLTSRKRYSSIYSYLKGVVTSEYLERQRNVLEARFLGMVPKSALKNWQRSSLSFHFLLQWGQWPVDLRSFYIVTMNTSFSICCCHSLSRILLIMSKSSQVLMP